MTLTTRMTRLLKADVHGLLDRLEEPEALLRQAVRDMEEELAHREARLESVRGEAERAHQRAARLAEEESEQDRQLDLCLGSGKEDLARGVVRRKLESARLRKAFEARAAEATVAGERLSRELDEGREKLADVRRRMEIFVTEPLATDADPAARQAPVTDDDVEIALLRELEKRGGGK